MQMCQLSRLPLLCWIDFQGADVSSRVFEEQPLGTLRSAAWSQTPECVITGVIATHGC